MSPSCVNAWKRGGADRRNSDDPFVQRVPAKQHARAPPEAHPATLYRLARINECDLAGLIVCSAAELVSNPSSLLQLVGHFAAVHYCTTCANSIATSVGMSTSDRLCHQATTPISERSWRFPARLDGMPLMRLVHAAAQPQFWSANFPQHGSDSMK